MTTISNLNVVVQHGDLSREAQNLKNQPLDPSQPTVSQQVDKENQQRTTVSEFEDAEQTKFETQKEGEGQLGEREKKKRRKKKKHHASAEENPDGTGRLLDTIA